MKRILSLIMSVLMIATMFCGFAVTSTAADAPVHVTVIASEPDADGIINVEFWAKDNTDFGIFNMGFYLKWDETKLEPVTTAVSGVNAIFEVSDSRAFVKAFNAEMDTFGSSINFACATAQLKTSGRPPVVLGEYVTGAAPYNWFAIGHSGDAAYCYSFVVNADMIDSFGLNAADFGVDYEKGLRIATASFKAVEGATGEAKIWAETENKAIQVANDDYVTFVGMPAEEGLSCTPAVIDLGSDEPAYELPAGVTKLEVLDGVSARTADPAGLRFVSNVVVEDWANVSEMGTAIVKAGTKPGVDTTLNVPARIDFDGNYLQSFTKTEDGLYNFEDGIIAEALDVTYTGVISNIKDSNLDAEFTAYAYIVIDGVTYYSENGVTGCYSDVLGAAANDPTIA